MTRFVFVFVAFLAFPALVFSATIHVPGDYPTIQAGIDATGPGDTVVVAPGTYVENIIFKGKAITVKSSNGPHVTTIDGNQFTHVVMFNQNEGLDTVLEGFTLTNGDHSKGAGIYCKDSASPSILGNVITGNKAGEGAGIFCIHAEPVIMGNTISNNSAGAGGGIYCDNCEPYILNNVIIDNTTTASGGGIYCFLSSPEIINNTFTGNKAGSGRGGAIAGNNYQANIVNSILWGNSAPSGPEIGIGTYDDPTVTFCDVKGGWTGTGNIDADPLFVAPAGKDYHLTYPSPCRDTGDNSAAGLRSGDFEGDPRIAYGTVDMGADEFYTHLYWTGEAEPGENVEVKLVGLPYSAPVGLFIGAGVLDPPISSMWGDWYLMFPIIGPISLPAIPSTGVLAMPGTIPGTPLPPYSIPMQALIGAELTNLSIMEVED